MAMYRSLNAFGNFAMAAERLAPCSTSLRTSVSVLASSLLLTCSDRIDSARRIGSPEFTMVANCREKIAISLSLIFAGLMLISRLRPFFSLPTSSGVYPISRRRSRTRRSLSATSVPVTRFPDLSRTLY